MIYNLYSTCVGNWYILTDDELAERGERPEYEECCICGDTDEWHYSSSEVKDLAFYLKSNGVSDEVILSLTEYRVYAEEVNKHE
ncbi:TPA: hypothetical protein ACGO11_000534 [Streptococcus suis]